MNGTLTAISQALRRFKAAIPARYRRMAASVGTRPLVMGKNGTSAPLSPSPRRPTTSAPCPASFSFLSPPKMQFLTLVSLFALALTAVGASSDYPVGAKGFSKVQKTKNPLRILLSNDDSWASANVRATYYALKTAGHNVVLVSPAANQSGKGGTVVLPVNKTLTTPGRNNSIPVGAPFAGRNETDAGINYFDGSPAATVLWALDNVVSNFFNGKGPQLTVTGPNEGTNLGPFL